MGDNVVFRGEMIKGVMRVMKSNDDIKNEKRRVFCLFSKHTTQQQHNTIKNP